jgi:hypothetical protein
MKITAREHYRERSETVEIKTKDAVVLEVGNPIGPKSRFTMIWLRFD